MGSVTWNKIERDTQKTIKDAIKKKKGELDTCEKEIKKLIQDAKLYKVLDLNSQLANIKLTYTEDLECLFDRLSELGKQKIILTRKIQALEGLQDNFQKGTLGVLDSEGLQAHKFISEEMDKFYDDLQKALTGLRGIKPKKQQKTTKKYR